MSESDVKLTGATNAPTASSTETATSSSAASASGKSEKKMPFAHSIFSFLGMSSDETDNHDGSEKTAEQDPEARKARSAMDVLKFVEDRFNDIMKLEEQRVKTFIKNVCNIFDMGDTEQALELLDTATAISTMHREPPIEWIVKAFANLHRYKRQVTSVHPELSLAIEKCFSRLQVHILKSKLKNNSNDTTATSSTLTSTRWGLIDLPKTWADVHLLLSSPVSDSHEALFYVELVKICGVAFNAEATTEQWSAWGSTLITPPEEWDTLICKRSTDVFGIEVKLDDDLSKPASTKAESASTSPSPDTSTSFSASSSE